MDSETILATIILDIQTQKQQLSLLENSDFNCGAEKAYNEILGLAQFYFDEVTKDKHKDDSVSDPVDHPSHYTDGNIEVITYIEDKGLIEGFCKGNAIKYISRAGKKESAALQIDEKELQDIKKARWYLDYLIGYYERKKGEK